VDLQSGLGAYNYRGQGRNVRLRSRSGSILGALQKPTRTPKRHWKKKGSGPVAVDHMSYG